MTDNILNQSGEKGRKVLEFGRIISRETEIPHDNGILITAPGCQMGLKASQLIKERFESIGCKAEILYNPEHDVMLNCKCPIIVIGNLADSKCVEYLYYKFLCITDKSYPGDKGYRLSTVIDPFATGFNIIHIGYSDDDGLENGVRTFLSKVSNPIPYLNEVFYTKLPYDRDYIDSIKHIVLPAKTDLIPSSGASNWWATGLVSYITGDPKPLETYLDGWRKMIELSKLNDYLIINTHLYMYYHMEPWRLLEYSGMIPDELRGPIEKCIFDWAQSSQGIGYAGTHSSAKNLPSHNHTMFCALSLVYAADYFNKRYPKLSEPKNWKKIADDVFYTFNNNGWKPYCDDSSYSNQVSIPLVCMYSIFEDNHVFLDTSAREAGKWVKAIIGQNGIIPSFGDGSVKSPFPMAIAMLFAHYYKDGEMLFLIDRFKEKTYTLGTGKTRLFDSGVKSVPISESSVISCIPMDKYIYDVWDKNTAEGRRLATTPPYGRYEDCFDKVSIRTGWNRTEDDFLLIDGLGSNGVHAYNDAMGILDYTSKGLVWLVEENCYRWPEPENCSILTVARDGYASDIPGYALMEEQKVIDENKFYLRMRLKNYNGTDWIREIFMIKGLCIVFHDTVVPEQSGEYVICAHFRTPAKARVEGNTMKSLRYDHNGNVYELRLTGYGSADVNVSVEEIPFGERLFSYGGMYDDINMKDTAKSPYYNPMWTARYNNDDLVVSSMTTQSSVHLEKGRKISFTHTVFPAKPEDDDINLQKSGDRIQLSYKDKLYDCPFIHVADSLKNGKSQQTVMDSNKVDLRTKFTINSSILSFKKICENTYVCAMENRNLTLVENGEICWEKSLKGEINVIEYIAQNKMIAVGHGKNKLSTIDLKGELLWETQTKRVPTLFPSWELPYPKIVSINCFVSDKDSIIVTGCGDNRIRIYNSTGKMLNDFYTYATVPDTVEIVDIDQDKAPEILAASKTESSSGTFYVHDIYGNPKRNISVSGWLCNIRCHQLYGNNGSYTLVCGMNYSHNFKIFNIENGNQKIICEKSLGGTVASICMNDDNTVIYTGTSKGSVLAFDDKGNHKWHVYVKDSVKSLFSAGGNVITVCDNGNICVISTDGVMKGTCRLPEKPAFCMRDQDNVLISCKNSVYAIGFQ